MALSDHLKSTARQDRIEAVMRTLDPEDAETLREALADRINYSGGDIARALQAEGFDVDPGQVSYHRRKAGL